MKDNFVIYFALFMTSFIVYSYYLSVFLETHGGWILLTLICIFVFFSRRSLMLQHIMLLLQFLRVLDHLLIQLFLHLLIRLMLHFGFLVKVEVMMRILRCNLLVNFV